ncbi:MAG: hypothetical protein JSR64_17010 [Nitrospira sp.]|nr:hypothetical protein [Nitrospira sp.]
MEKVTGLPEPQNAIRDRWSAEIVATLRANPGTAYKVFSGLDAKLLRSRAGYLRSAHPDIQVRLIVSDDDPTVADLYAQAPAAEPVTKRASKK